MYCRSRPYQAGPGRRLDERSQILALVKTGAPWIGSFFLPVPRFNKP